MRYDGVITNFPDLNNIKSETNTLIVSNRHNDVPGLDNTTLITTDENTLLSVMKLCDSFDILSDNLQYINDEEFLYEYCKIKNIQLNKLPTNILNTNVPQTYNYDMS